MPIGPKPPSAEQIGELAWRLDLDLTAEEIEAYARIVGAGMPAYRRLDELAAPKPPVRYPRGAGLPAGAGGQSLQRLVLAHRHPGCRDRPAGGRARRGEGRDLRRRRPHDGRAADPRRLRARYRRHRGHAPARRRRGDSPARRMPRTRAGARPAPWVPCATPTSRPMCPARRRRGAPWCWRRARWTWRSAATRAARSASPPPGPVSTDSSRPTALVPYTGCMMIETTLDHVGPMANSTEAVARMLSVLAGPDPLDPRQRGVIPPDYVQDYTPAPRARRGRPEDRRGQGRVRPAALGGPGPAGERGGGGRQGEGCAATAGIAGCRGRRGLHPHAPRGTLHLSGHHHRRVRAVHVRGERRRHELVRLPRRHADRGPGPRPARSPARAAAGRRGGRAHGRIPAALLRRSLLRQGPEPAPDPRRRLRRRAARPRSPRDADHPVPRARPSRPRTAPSRSASPRPAPCTPTPARRTSPAIRP